MATLSFEDVESAARRLAGRIHRTPVLTSRSLDEAKGIADELGATYWESLDQMLARMEIGRASCRERV